MAKFLPTHRLRMIVNGLFMSKLMYCLQVFGAVWGIPSLQAGDRRNTCFTRANLHMLQVLQNKVMRLLARRGYETPVTELLAETNMLSVNQLIAYTTVMTIFKVKKSGEPSYLADRLKVGQQHYRRAEHITVNYNLSMARECFFYRGAKLWNLLPDNLKNQNSVTTFKKC